MTTERWYAIRTKPRQEKQAEFHLRQLCVETFLPLLRQNKMVRRARKMVLSPLFPGYMFARVDVRTHYRTVNFARGVLTIVGFGGKPAEMSQELIDTIKRRLENGYLTPDPKHFKRGQILHINGGPLAGLEAVFVREMTDRNRVLVLLNTLGLHAKLNISINQVSLPRLCEEVPTKVDRLKAFRGQSCVTGSTPLSRTVE
jgi:transcriptional antiterminator RfaH